MTHCWEQRGCDDEMQSRCPHNTPGETCPADCAFAACYRPTHEVCSDFDLLFRLDLDRDASIKDICRFCTFFLKHGPSLAPGEHPSTFMPVTGARPAYDEDYRAIGRTHE